MTDDDFARHNMNAFCRADERWVCAACGKFTKAGGARSELHDTSCMTHAVRCEAQPTGWRAIGVGAYRHPLVSHAELVVLQQMSGLEYGAARAFVALRDDLSLDAARKLQHRAAALSLAERVLRRVE